MANPNYAPCLGHSADHESVSLAARRWMVWKRLSTGQVCACVWWSMAGAALTDIVQRFSRATDGKDLSKLQHQGVSSATGEGEG